MSRYILITDGGALVTLSAANPDGEAVTSATERLAQHGVSRFVGEARGPASSDGDLTFVRAFSDPAQTFAEARARLAIRKRSSGNSVFRVGGR